MTGQTLDVIQTNDGQPPTAEWRGWTSRKFPANNSIKLSSIDDYDCLGDHRHIRSHPRREELSIAPIASEHGQFSFFEFSKSSFTEHNASASDSIVAS